MNDSPSNELGCQQAALNGLVVGAGSSLARWFQRGIMLALVAASCVLAAPLAFAQSADDPLDADEEDFEKAEESSEEESPEEESPDEGEESPSLGTRGTNDSEAPQAVEGGVPRHVAREHRLGAATYRLPKEKVWAPLEWEGGRIFGQVEIDTGYATYRYPEREDRPRESLHDMRGRFVLGPAFHYDFPTSDYFLEVVAQFVAWVREQSNQYQINVDDIYVQIGKGTKWDFQLGRFMTWRVYHRGLGFDLFTLEDNGASRVYPISNGNFAVHTYEVDYIFLRNSPYVGGEVAGRAAFHYYPTDVLGFELAAAYGLADNQGTNTLGGRFAADLQWEFLRLSAGAEARRQRQTGPPNTVQNPGTPMERTVECTDCGASNNYGYGGGAILSFPPITLGGGIARGIDEKFQAQGDAEGVPGRDRAASSTRMSFGGYFEFDLGTLAFERPLILGVGAHRTELIRDNEDQDFHLLAAAYAALPLGINDAMVKLVVSRAQADLYEATDEEGTEFIDEHPNSTTVRLRFSSNF